MEARAAVDDVALGREAWSVLDANWTGSATVPAPGLYPHQWNWDSTFVAIGLSRSDTRRAGAELLSLLAGQWRTGMVPHIVFHPASAEAYFPGPSVWRSQDHPASPNEVLTSGLTQPPLQGLPCGGCWRHATDREMAAAFVRRLYPMLAAQHDYLTTARDLGGGGLAAIVHPWESGMDDSPVWDAPLAALPQVRYAYRERGGPPTATSTATTTATSGWPCATATPATTRPTSARITVRGRGPDVQRDLARLLPGARRTGPAGGRRSTAVPGSGRADPCGAAGASLGRRVFHARDLRSGRLSPSARSAASGRCSIRGCPPSGWRIW